MNNNHPNYSTKKLFPKKTTNSYLKNHPSHSLLHSISKQESQNSLGLSVTEFPSVNSLSLSFFPNPHITPRKKNKKNSNLIYIDLEMEGNSSGGGGGNDVELVCKTLQVEHKLFYFDLKENPRGRYLKISEKTSATRSTIIVPSNGVFLVPWSL